MREATAADAVPREAWVAGATREEMVCRPMAMRLTLKAMGMLDDVEAFVALDADAQIAWEYAVEMVRVSPLIDALKSSFTNPLTGLPITDDEIDAIFRAAMLIDE